MSDPYYANNHGPSNGYPPPLGQNYPTNAGPGPHHPSTHQSRTQPQYDGQGQGYAPQFAPPPQSQGLPPQTTYRQPPQQQQQQAYSGGYGGPSGVGYDPRASLSQQVPGPAPDAPEADGQLVPFEEQKAYSQQYYPQPRYAQAPPAGYAAGYEQAYDPRRDEDGYSYADTNDSYDGRDRDGYRRDERRGGEDRSRDSQDSRDRDGHKSHKHRNKSGYQWKYDNKGHKLDLTNKEKGVGVGALGAGAGGVIGHEMGGGIATLGGIVAGAVGAGLLEKRNQRKERKKQELKKDEDRPRDGRDGRDGRDEDDDDDDYDSRDESEEDEDDRDRPGSYQRRYEAESRKYPSSRPSRRRAASLSDEYD